ncbi:hypothetical protein C8N43_0907 [Litoreibacter ponti]|uniref:Uncharacterized protein n=1 Tax=Litoreibacter ponti TaxID=1510457 RepID=A0A2T6BJM5_9RHOB|nr:hypothetical protein [Litoreibacter ponti]PTX56254.1 hypothetical protein C8N43_0907 [Litoreibacter ponti]
MTLMDYTWDVPVRDASIDVETTRWGYRITEMAQTGWVYASARVALMALTVGVIASAGLIWTIPVTAMFGDPLVSRILLSVALLVVAAAMVGSGVFSKGAEMLEVDVKGRVLHLRQHGRAVAGRKARKTVRFEEITRIDLAETSLLSELKSALSQWDYGRITVRLHGKRPMMILSGDMSELEPLLRRLRADTGVA